MLKALRWWKPSSINILGDFGDFYTVSSHSKDPRRGNKLEEEAERVNERLDQVDALGADEKKYALGNHEDRLDRYLADKAPELSGLVSTEKLFRLKERGWAVTPYKRSHRQGKVYVTHDTGVAGQNAHIRALNDFQDNVVIGHCLPVSYEVLTDRGFKRLDEILIGDTVLAYENGQVIKTPVLDRVLYEAQGPMIEFDNHVIAQRMTHLHHLYTQDGRYIPVQAGLDTLTKADLVRHAAPLASDEYPVSDALLRLVVAYCADGSRGSAGSLRFHLKKPRKISRLQKLFKEAGGAVGFAKPGKNGGRKTIKMSRDVAKALIELCPDKQLPDWLLNLSARQRQIVVDELPLWDGSALVHDNAGDAGLRQFCSTKVSERNLVQLLLMQHGIRSRQYKHAVSYDVFEWKKSTNSTLKLRSFASIEQPAKNERVGCITTRVQNFFVRTDKHGSVELSGNTHRLAVSYVGNAQGKTHVGMMAGWLGDVNKVDYMHLVKAQRDWHLGFGIGYQEPGGVVHLQAVPIIDYRVVLEGRLFVG